MSAFKISILVTLLCGFLHSSASQTRDCSGTCKLQFKCDPYAKELVWTISGRVCRVFKNSCLLGSQNCQRENQCLRVLTATSQEKCMKYCPTCCPLGGPPVCAFFYYSDIHGVRTDRQITFPSRCHADQYACQKADAYIGEPSIGACS